MGSLFRNLEYSTASQRLWLSVMALAVSVVVAAAVITSASGYLWLQVGSLGFSLLFSVLAWRYWQATRGHSRRWHLYRLRPSGHLPPSFSNTGYRGILKALAEMGEPSALIFRKPDSNDAAADEKAGEIAVFLLIPMNDRAFYEKLPEARSFVILQKVSKGENVVKQTKRWAHAFVAPRRARRSRARAIRTFLEHVPTKHVAVWATQTPEGIQGGLAFPEHELPAPVVDEEETTEYLTDKKGMVVASSKRKKSVVHDNLAAVLGELFTANQLSLIFATKKDAPVLRYGAFSTWKRFILRWLDTGELEQSYQNNIALPPFSSVPRDRYALGVELPSWYPAKMGVGFERNGKKSKGKTVSLRPNSLVFGGGFGQINPAVMWAKHIGTQYVGQWVIVDFDGSGEIFLEMAENMADIDITTIDMDDEVPMSVVNLFHVPEKFTERTFWRMVGVGAAYLEQYVRSIHEHPKQDMRALQAFLAFYLGSYFWSQILPTMRPYSPLSVYAQLTGRQIIVDTMNRYRDAVYEIMQITSAEALGQYDEAYEAIADVARNIYSGWTNAGRRMDISSLPAGRIGANYLPVFQQFLNELGYFSAEPAAFYIANPESEYDLTTPQVVYIKFTGGPENAKSHLHEWVLMAAAFLRELQSAQATVPTNLLVTGVSQVPPKPKAHLFKLLQWLAKRNHDAATHYMLIADEIPDDGYGSLIRYMHDMWLFRVPKIPAKVSSFLERAKVRSNVLVLPPNKGYLIRFTSVPGKPTKAQITNVVTGLPASRDATRLDRYDDDATSGLAHQPSALELLSRMREEENKLAMQAIRGGIRLVDD